MVQDTQVVYSVRGLDMILFSVWVESNDLVLRYILFFDAHCAFYLPQKNE